MSVFEINNNKDHTKRQMFLDGPVDIQRFDTMRYPIFDKLSEQQNGFFWRPQEVDCHKDAKDFKTLTPNEQHIFTSNIKRQIVLDSVQGRAPLAVLGPIASLPEIENWLTTWTYFEGVIHSRSYTHVIQSVYANPSVVLDGILDIPEIVACANDISKYYDWLAKWNLSYSVNAQYYDKYEHKKALWLCLNSINALEGVRFYVSFACSWAFAEMKKMEGNAKIIKFIARDENIHLASTQHMLKILARDDPDFAKIREDTRQECIDMWLDVVKQEEDWADYLFKDGSMIGLNALILKEHTRGAAHVRMTNIGLASPYGAFKMLPWTKKWISGGDVQVAPQETESTMYIQGVKKDTQAGRFASFEL